MNRLLRFLFTGAAIFIFGVSTASGGYVYHQGPGLVQAPLITQTLQEVGQADVWCFASVGNGLSDRLL